MIYPRPLTPLALLACGSANPTHIDIPNLNAGRFWEWEDVLEEERVVAEEGSEAVQD
jgi:hypothetical protein